MQKIQWRASSGDGAPKLQISVPCRGRTCPWKNRTKKSTQKSTAKFKSEFGSFAAKAHTARIWPREEKVAQWVGERPLRKLNIAPTKAKVIKGSLESIYISNLVGISLSLKTLGPSLKPLRITPFLDNGPLRKDPRSETPPSSNPEVRKSNCIAQLQLGVHTLGLECETSTCILASFSREFAKSSREFANFRRAYRGDRKGVLLEGVLVANCRKFFMRVTKSG